MTAKVIHWRSFFVGMVIGIAIPIALACAWYLYLARQFGGSDERRNHHLRPLRQDD